SLTRELLDRTLSFCKVSPTAYVRAMSHLRKAHHPEDPEPDVLVTRRGTRDIRNNDALLIRQQQVLLTRNLKAYFPSLDASKYLSDGDSYESIQLSLAFLPEKMQQTTDGQAVLRKLLLKSLHFKTEDHTHPARTIIPLLSMESWRHPELEGILIRLLTEAPEGGRRDIARTIFESIKHIPKRQIRNLPLYMARRLAAGDQEAVYDALVLATRFADSRALGVAERDEWMRSIDYAAVRRLHYRGDLMSGWHEKFLATFFADSPESLQRVLFSADYGDLTPKHFTAAMELVEYLERQNLAEKERAAFLHTLSHLESEGLLPEAQRESVRAFLKARPSYGRFRSAVEKCVQAAYSAFQ
ncbi:MAG: hypothetical protein KDD51_11945, partial [Bdellovibrionales bacterium]|nr:hypothetical protein [Bdellovibrionales bacterium]